MSRLVFKLTFICVLGFLISCGSKTVPEKKSQSGQKSQELETDQLEITKDTLKQNKKDLLEQMANELYNEGQEAIDNAPLEKMDETGIYDDVKPVEVIIVPELPVNLDLGIDLPDEGQPEHEPKKNE